MILMNVMFVVEITPVVQTVLERQMVALTKMNVMYVMMIQLMIVCRIVQEPGVELL